MAISSTYSELNPKEVVLANISEELRIHVIVYNLFHG